MEQTQVTRQKVIACGQELISKGLVAGTWGNISARVAETDLIVITPSGKAYPSLSARDAVVVNSSGTVIEGHFRPSSELPLHLEVYAARPDVKAIVHTHSVFASACAVAHKEIPPIIEDLVQVIGGAVAVAAYALPGTAELAKNTVKALQNRNGVLLANHGVLGCGRSLQEALTACELVEKAARIYIYSMSIGGPRILSDSDVAIMHKFYLEHYRRQEEC